MAQTNLSGSSRLLPTSLDPPLQTDRDFLEALGAVRQVRNSASI